MADWLGGYNARWLISWEATMMHGCLAGKLQSHRADWLVGHITGCCLAVWLHYCMLIGWVAREKKKKT